jgi:hypothetical protein
MLGRIEQIKRGTTRGSPRRSRTSKSPCKSSNNEVVMRLRVGRIRARSSSKNAAAWTAHVCLFSCCFADSAVSASAMSCHPQITTCHQRLASAKLSNPPMPHPAGPTKRRRRAASASDRSPVSHIAARSASDSD